MPTCEQMTALITNHLEGRLSFGARVGFFVHVAVCSHCREYLRQMKLSVRVLACMPSEPLSLDVEKAVLETSSGVRT